MSNNSRGWVGVVVFAVLLGLAAAAGLANALHTAFTHSLSEGYRDVALGIALLVVLLALLRPRRRPMPPLPRRQVTPSHVPMTDFMPDPPPPPVRRQQSLPGATIVDGSIEDLE